MASKQELERWFEAIEAEEVATELASCPTPGNLAAVADAVREREEAKAATLRTTCRKG